MDIGSILLILALLVLVGLFVSRPLSAEPKKTRRQNARQVADANAADHAHSMLLAERDRVLDSLQELSFDYTLGKIPEKEYPAQRAALLAQGAEILRQIDASLPESEMQTEQSAEDRLEAAIAARRAQTQPAEALVQSTAGNGRGRGVSAAIAEPDEDLEVLLANRRRQQQEKAAGFCHKCGGPLRKSDRFCPKCGAENA